MSIDWFGMQARRQRQAHWVQMGIVAFKTGIAPSKGPFKYHTRAYIWWVAGWCIQWQAEEWERG